MADDRLAALDPAADAAAIRSLLRARRQSFPRELQALAHRVAAESTDAVLQADALNVLASAAVVAGDDDEGARQFRRSLAATWGSGTHAERVACINLAMIVTRQRRLIEAFALARRACQVALQGGDALAACLSHAQLAKTLLELGDRKGFEVAVELAEEHRPEMDETLAGWVPHLLAGLHAEVAVGRGDFERAGALMEEALDDPDVIPEVVALGRATFLRRIGQAGQALPVIRAALAAHASSPSQHLRLLAEELLCLLDLGDREAVVARAERCLDAMERDGRASGTPTWRMRIGDAVGRELAKSVLTRVQALRAFEMAAVAALERSWESKQFFREFPQLEHVAPEDVALIEAHGERFRSEHRELMAAIGALLSGGDRHVPPIPEPGRQELFVSACAWCRRVRGPERTWIPVGQLRVEGRGFDVTHGICEGCTVGLARERTAMLPAGPAAATRTSAPS